MNDPQQFSVFAPFTKVSEQADGSILVHAIVNDETIDDQGEQVAYEAVVEASGEYMKWAAVREMHGESAAGTMVSLTHDEASRTTEGIIRVVDPVAIKKVQTGVYKGTSLGGRKRERVMAKVGGVTVPRLTKIDWIETSLVDRPSRPTAVLTLLKRADDPTPSEGDAMSTPAATAEAVETPTDDPLAKAAETDEPVAPVTPETAPEAVPLAKAAADDLTSVHIAKEQIARLIEKESAEGDSDQVAPLKAALALLDTFEASEAEELGTPEDTAQAAEEDAEAIPIVFAYAAVIGDLAKRAATMRKAGKRNSSKDQSNIDQIHDLSVAAGAYPADHTEPDATDESGDEPVAKAAASQPGLTPDEFVDRISDRLTKNATFLRQTDMDAVKAELLEAIRPVQEELAKIAAQPMPGGPLRYAPDQRGIYGGAPATAAVDDAVEGVLRKVSDPVLREELGRALAAEQIRTGRG